MKTLNLSDNRIQSISTPNLIGASIENLCLNRNSESIQRIDLHGIEHTELAVLELNKTSVYVARERVIASRCICPKCSVQ